MSVFIRTKVKEEENSVDYNNNEKSETSSNTSSNPLNKSVRLSLNKPKEWKWELSTSKSSPHIAFPLIQLYDSGTGNLLVEADDDECVFQGNEQLEKATIKGVEVPIDHFRPRAKTIHESLRESKSSKLEVPLSRSKSGSSRKSLLEAIEKDVVNKFVEQLKEQGIRCNVRSRSVSKARSIEPIDEEEPKVVKNLSKERTPDLLRVPNALNKSKSAAEIPRKHKKYSRSSSSVRFTSSFLQRVSECRDDSSSTSDSELLEEARQSKRYYYRSSKAGTLLLCEDSFNNKKSNRRSRNLDEALKTMENDEKMEERKKSSSKLKFAPSTRTKGISDENCMMPEEIEKKLNLNCVTDGIMKKANNNDKSSAATEKQSSTKKKMLDDDANRIKSVIRKSNFSKSNNDLSPRRLTNRQASPHPIRNSFGEFRNRTSEEDDDDTNKSNVYKRLNRHRRRTKQRNNLMNSSSQKFSSKEEDSDIDEFVEKMGTKAQQLRLQRPERGKKRRQQNIIDKNHQEATTAANTEKINEKQTFETGVVDTGKRKIPYSLEGLGKLYNDDVILQLVQQLTSLNNKEQQLPVSYRTKDKISEYQLQFREKSPRRLTTDDDTSFKQNEFPENGLNLTELNNNKPHAVNHNLCENGKIDDDVKGDEEEEMGSNVSRYSEKGLSGRRAHSSGNLFSGNSNANNTPSKKAQNKKFKKKNNVAADDLSDITSIASTTIAVPGGGGQQGGGNGYDNASFTDPCIVNDISLQQLYSPYNSSRTRQQKQTYHGSLPNHLDDADDDVVDGVIEQQRAFQNNNNKSCMVDGSRYGMNIDSPMIEQTSTDAYLMQYQNPNISQQKYQIQSSPYNGSNSTFRGSSQQDNQSNASTQQQQQQQHPMLHLPLINRNNDATYDPGYGSERSPEDEVPPLLPQMMQNLAITDETTTTLPSYLDYQQLHRYEFITKDSIFSVHIVKGPRGLGLSVSGGTDSTAPFPGLIRIKRLFPHQAAWSIGVLKQGDIILAVNGVQLTGLTNYEALEVLRTTPDEVFMIICRPSDERYRKLSPPAEPPMPPIRSHGVLDHFNNSFSGEFELILTKQQGSLGFTLRKEDENVLGHCVRALVREPALSDGRIKPGDKILAVNDIPISNMSHEQAVIFLRQAPDTVKLRLFRDDTLTPLSAVSPTEIERKALNMSSNSKKVVLRPEAINLLTDIAYRKQNSGGDDSTSSSVKSSSPSRRLKRAHKSPHSSTSGSQGSSSNTFMQQSGTESDTSTVVSHDTNNSCRVQQVSSHSSISYCNNGLISEPENEGEEEFYNEDELLSMVDDESYYGERPGRPNYLDLTQPGSTPTGLKKPQFSIAKANAYELNNLDNDVLDAPTIYTLNPSSEQIGDDFTSLPCETLLVECKNKKDLEYVSKFTRGHPMYQSQQSTTNENGSNGLLKWKGAMLAGDAEQDEREEMAKTPNSESICDVTVISQHELSRSSSNQSIIDSEGNQLITVELNRGWNSRLGFSVTKDGGHIYISAVYADSVAARDGRLRKNDRILTVNDESVDGKEKHEVIDLLRTIRGAIVITVARKFNANNNNGAPVHYDVGCETEGEN